MSGCAPGRGTSASYAISRSNYYRATTAAQQQATLARAQAEALEASSWKRAASDAARLARADELRSQGNLSVAVRMYARLARSRPPSDSSKTAKERLTQLGEDARARYREIDASLEREFKNVSPGELFDPFKDHSSDAGIRRWHEQVTEAFRQYDALEQDYHEVPSVAGEIRSHVSKQRKRQECAVVLNEPKAKALLDVAQEHDAQGHACCAYWVYREASELAPAPSAVRAQKRFEEMGQDADLLKKAEACRQLQRCHQMYANAERLLKVKPEAAKGVLAQIVALAPSDSEVYRAARQHLDELGP